MRLKHGYQKVAEGNFDCQSCFRNYKNQVDCENHMKIKHDFDSVAVRKKERKESQLRKYIENDRMKKEKAVLIAKKMRI